MRLAPSIPVRAQNAGLFICRGSGRHGERVINSHELIFVRQGELGMHEEGTCFKVSTGEMLLLRAGRRHGGTADYPSDLSFYWIHFDVVGDLRSSPVARKRKRIEGELELPRHGRVARPDRLAELFHQFLNDQESGRLTSLSADLLLTLMLHEASDRRVPVEADEAAGATLAAQANRLIGTRFHESLQTSTLAAELDCNPDYLGRVYQRAYGHTVTEAIHRARLKEARALLIEGLQNVTQIARSVGYSDAGYFRRVFRHQQGISPRTYRRMHARAHVNTK
jgi:AraC-like DNA-binding protein